MTAELNLKEIERKAFRSTYQDGLWDMLYGLVVVGMAVFIYRPQEGYSKVNIILAITLITAANILFQAGKKYITLPRMGQVRFGAVRQRKNQTLAIIMGVFVLCTVALVVMTGLGWFSSKTGSVIAETFNERITSLLIVSTLGALIVGSSMLVMAFFSDFTRGYYIALMMALAVFLMIYLNNPLYPIVIGLLIILPGMVLFLRFLRAYPLPKVDAFDE